ncbi:Vps16, N-terminal region-domain-containing protein [Chytriomyces sp. MP71]|nr:Vps16, N-terminal region-domain-containing protein [Chytriomyces sp. MP71]
MNLLSPTPDWTPLHNRFYCKADLYSLLWRDIDLSKHLVAAASLGGPVALIRNDAKSLALSTSLGAKQTLYVYSSSGKLINNIQVSAHLYHPGRIVRMFWSSSEQLVCAVDAGTIRVLDCWGDAISFSLGSDTRDFGILDVVVSGKGLVAMAGNFRLYVVDSLAEPRPRLLPDAGLSAQPHAWAVMSPLHTSSQQPEVLLAVKSTLLLIDGLSVQDLRIPGGPFTSIAISPNGKFIALFTSSGRVLVVSSDFQKQLAEFNTGNTQTPIQMAWCGNDSVTLHWEDFLLVVGPFGDCIRYAFDGIVTLISELDGLRILTNDRCQFLQKVPAATEDVFKIGSTAPGAILFDAFDHFGRKSPRADENIRSITQDLPTAVDTCLEAAANEFNSTRQKALLRAASFGKCFIEGYNTVKFTTMCETIRVLNAVRRFEVGIPLSFAQYCQMTPEVLVGRLTQRCQHSLALNVCTYLKMNPSRILVHWACTKVKNIAGSSTETLLQEITAKCSSIGIPVSYIQIAKTAYQHGHTKLAAQLLDHEPIAAHQVPLLLSMDQDAQALDRALASGDTDLVYACLLHVKRKHPMAEFFRILKGKEVALTLVEVYARGVGDVQLLKDFYYQDDRKSEMAGVLLVESFELSQLQSRINKLRDAQRLYQESKDHVFEAKALEDQIKLLQLQATLERETGQTFLDLSVSDTLYKCIVLGHANRATKVKTDMKVPERRYSWLKAKAIVEQRNWDALDTVSFSSRLVYS